MLKNGSRQMSKQIIITGGLGYIGSHTIVALKEMYDEFIIIDNLSNSDVSVVNRLKDLTKKSIIHFNMSINEENKLRSIFDQYNPTSVIHFAGLKSVRESELSPDKYFFTNVCGTVSLLNSIRDYNCKSFIFSSSATVYGDPEYLPYDEAHSTIPINNYGRSKLIAEQLIREWSSLNHISSLSLRYFNPVGAHPSGIIGEKPDGIPNNLMPFILQVISGDIEYLKIFGNDYDTKDGTGERDYIHVVDLADAHVAALSHTKHNYINDVINIGTGNSISVLEIINTFKEALNVDIKYKISDRRAGDLAKYFSNSNKANNLLKWKSKKSLLDMCSDSLRWQNTLSKL